MTIQEIGCCGAYCKTCKELTRENCLGCKLGYENGNRDIEKAKCQMKVCCFKEKKFQTCADCEEYVSCSIIQDWFNKNGYKYKKYKESIEFIRQNGYDKFLKIANSWKNQYGKLG
jgi:hypothetical protein